MLAAALILASNLATGPVVQQWTFTPEKTPRVRVSNVSGVIEVKAGGSEVKVEARSSDPGDWKAEAAMEGGDITVRACCGSCHAVANRCSDGGHLDLVLSVPAATRLTANNVSGDLRVEGVEGRQQLSNVSGRTSVGGAAAPLEVSSVSGDVELRPRAVADTSVSTVSGDVRLALPQGAGAEVRLSTVSGEIEGAGHGSNKKRTFGDGGQRVSVSTVSGNVKVEQ
jgi:hypothetical protein